MNKVILLGRITRDIELRTSDTGISVARFSVAVNRRFKNKDGNYDADFIQCVAFRQTADFLNKYFGKGSAISLCGSLQSRSYEKDGETRYTQEVVVDEVSFVSGSNNSRKTEETDSVMMDADELFGEELADFDNPF